MPTDSNMRTTTVTVSGEANVKTLCGELINASQWFSIMPLPDDLWEVAVKVENRDRLQNWTQLIETKNQGLL